jgi:hypothetical protein
MRGMVVCIHRHVGALGIYILKSEASPKLVTRTEIFHQVNMAYINCSMYDMEIDITLFCLNFLAINLIRGSVGR